MGRMKGERVKMILLDSIIPQIAEAAKEAEEAHEEAWHSRRKRGDSAKTGKRQCPHSSDIGGWQKEAMR
jgi:hypothetical protein